MQQDTNSISKDSEESEAERYKDKAYWQLPENVRIALDKSKEKNKHSEFYGRLISVND